MVDAVYSWKFVPGEKFFTFITLMGEIFIPFFGPKLMMMKIHAPMKLAELTKLYIDYA